LILTFQETGRPCEQIRGISVAVQNPTAARLIEERVRQRLRELSIDHHITSIVKHDLPTGRIEFQLRPDLADEWCPRRDTTRLCAVLGLDSQNDVDDLEREIWLAMTQCPIALEFPSVEELASSVSMRQRIVHAAHHTALTFATNTAERPPEHWDYTEAAGFVVRPGKSLIEALELATQPEKSGTLYSFSCYRATEYVMALAIAEEAAGVNASLLDRLQRQAEIRAIRSGEFHRVFCREVGSRADPLPLQFFIPGDRTWFRNPDATSSDASGFEGSWVFYVGNDTFTNFWRRGRVFSLLTKCLEIFHWRDGVYRDDVGELRMNESLVEQRVNVTLTSPLDCSRIFERMLRISDGPGVYAEGGCIDISREYPRLVCPGTSDIVLPDVDGAGLS